MRPPPPVDLADPAAVAAWVALARGKVGELHPLVVDATARRAHRKHARVYLRATMTRILRDVGVLLDALGARGDATAAVRMAPRAATRTDASALRSTKVNAEVGTCIFAVYDPERAKLLSGYRLANVDAEDTLSRWSPKYTL